MTEEKSSTGVKGDDKDHATLKYSLLGPSLTKPGQDAVDQTKVAEIIYEASKGSKFFNNEESRDKVLTAKIDKILEKKRQLERLDLSRERKKADDYIEELELSRDLSQVVVHVDCDAFYAAVEELDRPELREIPFAVGKGVLTTCNYHARKFGCRSGMAGFVAQKLCPQLLMISLNFEKYTAKATEVRAVLEQYDPRFESSSIDEAYLNITEYCALHDLEPEAAVQQLRDEVHEKAKITVSAGIAANSKLAKICSNQNKPNGQFRLANDRSTIMAFMRNLPTRKVNGIGRVFERELGAIGIKTCGEIYQYREYLWPLFGEKSFRFLMQCFLGLGRTTIQPAEEYERKSVGTERTFSDLSGHAALCDKLRQIAEELEKDMERTECKGRTLVLKIKLHTYEVFTRQVIPPKAVNQADDLYKFALPMLKKLEQEVPRLTLRLMGLRCTHLVSTQKPDTAAFFGLKRPSSGDSSVPKKRKSVAHAEEQWEQWPDDEFEEVAKQEYEDKMEELESLSQLVAKSAKTQRQTRPPGRGRTEEPVEEETWDCPICSRPQLADERAFNEHIDSCLSRQTIKEVVRGTSSRDTPVREITGPAKPTKPEGKKGRSRSTGDPRQKRLCFE
jgi:DNA polymerase kappa